MADRCTRETQRLGGKSLGLAPFIGFAAAALGTTVAGWVMLAQLWRGTRSLDGAAAIDARLKRALPRIALSCLVMGVVLAAGAAWLGEALATDYLRYGALALLVGLGAASYGAAVIATGAIRGADIRTALRRGAP